MGPGRLTGMNAGVRRSAPEVFHGFNGARSIDRDERMNLLLKVHGQWSLQWGPVD